MTGVSQDTRPKRPGSATATRAELRLDPQTGEVRTRSGRTTQLSDREMAIVYWLALGAPPGRIARAVRTTAGAVTDTIAALSGRLGVGDASWTLSLTNGHAPTSAHPWADRTAVALVRTGIDRLGPRAFLHVADQGTLSGDEVKDLVRQAVSRLTDEGIGKGDRVAIDATQRLESYLVAVATLLVGGVVVRLGDSVGPATLKKMIRQTAPSITFSARFAEIGPGSDAGRRVSFEPADDRPDFTTWLNVGGSGVDPQVTPSPSDPALIGFTSGSTGEPKPILTSHEAVFRSTEIAQALFRFQPDDVFCTTTDVTALSAFRSLVTFPFACGGRLVVPTPDARRHPLALALVCETYGVTRLTAVPNVLRGFLKAKDRIGRDRLARLRTVFSGSGVLDGPTGQGIRDAFGVPVVDYYGSREIATAVYADPDHPGSVSSDGGWPAQILLRLLADDGTACAVGDAGEICVHTDCMMIGALHPGDAGVGDGVDPASGWYRTGDIGRMRADGRVQVLGRIRDIVKTPDGGLVSPLEVEGVLNAAPAVREASVFGWTDPEGVERLAAAIIPTAGALETDGAKAVETALKTAVLTELGPFKVPAHLSFHAELPRVGRDKVDKRRLRAALEASVGTRGPATTNRTDG